MHNAFVMSEVRHAFTGHEDLGEIGLIHMNGRLYDPAIGRFLSADPTIQYPSNMQNYNRYSYIDNNPLSAGDPSGYGFLSKIRKAFKKFVKASVKFAFKPTIKNGLKLISSVPGQSVVDNFILKNPILNSVGQIAATVFTYPVCGGCGGVAWSAYYGYQATGSVNAGLRAGAITAATTVAFGYAGDAAQATGSMFVKIAGHALVGCAASVAGGGQCGSGALAGAFGAATEGFASCFGKYGGTAISAVVGGTASVLGGGKFENGAITGAFGYLFNCYSHPGTCTPDEQKAWERMGAEAPDAIEPVYPVENLLLGGMAFKSVGYAWSAGLNGGYNTVFWSGKGTMLYAQRFGTTLELTPIGSLLNFVHNSTFIKIDSVIWNAASRTFANNARGMATAVLNSPRANSVWSTVESSVLRRRDVLVNIITHHP